MFETRTVTGPDEELVRCARHLLDHALPADLQDDRFSDTWADDVRDASTAFVGAMASLEGHPLGLVAGTPSRSRLQLDALVSPHHDLDPSVILDHLLSDLRPHIDRLSVDVVELWGKPALGFHQAIASAHGFVDHRTLHQLRCPLPVEAAGLDTRAFVPGQDDEALRLLNNRSFAGHPDQGDLSPADLAARLAEPWFDPEGLRLHEGDDGSLVGFCWTKIHREQGFGEIYAIGIDPAHHGKGLGVPMTASGLHWLHDQGLQTGMLYVEGDNEPALRTYRKLGFDVVRTDRAWRRPRLERGTPTLDGSGLGHPANPPSVTQP